MAGVSDERLAGPRLLRVTVDGPEQTVVELVPAVAVVSPLVAGPTHDPPTDPPTSSLEGARVSSLLAMPSSSHGGPRRYEVVVDGWRFEVEVESAARAALRDRASRAGLRGLGGGRQVVRALIPGRVVAVVVSAGEVVEAGQRLLSVEAMKMENAVIAPWAGTIANVGVAAGQTVELGDELVVIE